jgi:hypothetical protein
VALMKRWLSGFIVLCMLAMTFAVFQTSSGTSAQDDSAESQASAIADLQTRVAVLETAAAGGTQEADAGSRPALTLTSRAGDSAVLFEEPAATGFTDWTEGYFGGFGDNQFTVQDDMLVAEPGFWTVLYAPYLTESPDYIVEAEMRQPPNAVTPEAGSPVPIVSAITGLAVRYWNASWDEQAGYTAYLSGGGYPYIESPGDESIQTQNLLPGIESPDPADGEWHTYRVEIRGDTLRFYLDGVLIIEALGLQYQGTGEEGRVGILVSLGAVEIRSFRVLAWE